MSLATALFGFALRQVLGDDVKNVFEAARQLLTDHSTKLPKALERAHDRAWQALGVALAGDGILDRVKGFVASGDEKGFRQQVAVFLNHNKDSFAGTPAEVRSVCLDELKRLRKSGLLSTQGFPTGEVARSTAGFQRYVDDAGLIEGATQAVGHVAYALKERYPKLSWLLGQPTPSGPPLFVAAFAYFFRREVETDQELAQGLFFDGLRRLTDSQAEAFREVHKALDQLDGRFDGVFEQMVRIESAVLDIQAEIDRLRTLQLRNAEEVRSLLGQVIELLMNSGRQRGEVGPQHGLPLPGENEQQMVDTMLERYRQLPQEERRQLPALQSALGNLHVEPGDFAGFGKVDDLVFIEQVLPLLWFVQCGRLEVFEMEKGAWVR
jgi:hypothetical protein